MRFLHSLCVAVLVASTSNCFAASSTASLPDESGQLVSNFSVAKKTEVPGAVLKPGSYSIRVVDHLSDRVILQIQSTQGKALTTFLGLPNSTVRNNNRGPVVWSAGPKGEDALRGFVFPGGASLEFVYPKEEAVSIAKVNTSKVAAIDPASQGLPTSENKLSKNDMQMLNLWLLSTTTVGPANDSQPAVQAERYRAPEDVQVASTEPSQTAAPLPPPATRVRARRQAPPATQQVASAKPAAAISALPHTASDLPTIFLVGLLALLGAGALRMVRLSIHES